MKELTLNVYANNEFLYLGLISDRVLLKKSIKLNDALIHKDFEKILKQEVLILGKKKVPIKLNIIENNSTFLKNKENNINHLFKVVQTTDIQTALYLSYKKLNKESIFPEMILFLDSDYTFLLIDENGFSEIPSHILIHTEVDELGRECNCGKLGCIIKYASPNGLVKSVQEKIEFYSGPTKFSTVAPSELKFKDFLSNAKNGDPMAIETLNSMMDLLLPKLIDMLLKYNVNKVLISGRLGQFGKLISKKFQSELSLKKGKNTPVLTPFTKSFEEIFVSINYDKSF